jgi:hypothetical protein
MLQPGNRSNGFPISLVLIITWLKPGANESDRIALIRSGRPAGLNPLALLLPLLK